MKKISCLFIYMMMVVPLVSFGQIQKVQLSIPYQVIDAKEKFYLKKGDDILTVKLAGRKVHMQKLNAKSVSFIKKNTLEDLPDGYSFERLMLFNDRCYFFFSLWNREALTEQLFYREIDFENATFLGEEKLLFKEEGRIAGTLTSGGFYNFSVTDKFDFFTSFDNSKLIIQYRMKPEEKRDALNKDLIGLRVFGKNLEKVWGDVIQMPYTEKEMNNLDYSVDSDGNAYILSTVYDDNTTNEKRKDDDEIANYHIELLRVKAYTKTIEKSRVEIKDKFINTIWMYEGPDNFIYCAGFYNNGASLSSANGIFMFKLGREGNVYDVRSFEIPVEVLNQYVSARTQKRNEKLDDKGKAEFVSLELREFLVENDGSIVLVGEQHYIRRHTTYTSNGGSRTTYTYHFNDILITKIDAQGRLAWMKKLPKRQTASSSAYMPRFKGGMSYTLIKGVDGYHVLFLDNIKNLDLALDEVPAGHSNGMGGYLIDYKINYASGQTTKVPVFDMRNVEGIAIYQFTVDRILQTNPDEFVVEAYKKAKEDILIKVNLK